MPAGHWAERNSGEHCNQNNYQKKEYMSRLYHITTSPSLCATSALPLRPLRSILTSYMFSFLCPCLHLFVLNKKKTKAALTRRRRSDMHPNKTQNVHAMYMPSPTIPLCWPVVCGWLSVCSAWFRLWHINKSASKLLLTAATNRRTIYYNFWKSITYYQDLADFYGLTC